MDLSKVKEEPQEWGSEVIANIKVENENSYETTFFVEIDMEMKQEQVDTNWTETCDNPFDSSSVVCKEELHDKSLESVIVSEGAVDTLRQESDLFSRQQCVKSITNKELSECVNPKSSNYNLDHSMRPIKLEPSVKYEPMSADCTRPIGSSAEVLMVANNIKENITSRELESSKNQIIPVKLKERECKKRFSCNLCNHKCVSKKDLAIHMRTHTGEKPFSCNLCNHKFSIKCNLVSHMKTHTGEKHFSCNLCNHKFGVKSNLVNHMRTHTGEKPFSCNLCSYKCSRKSSLVSHMRIHTREKPFSCNLCSYKFSQKSHLVSHMRIHTSEKHFSCHLCNYKCGTKNNLLCHLRTHTGEKLLSCSLCNYNSASKSNLVRHMRTHTGEKPFLCNLCSYKCSRKTHLVNHMRSHSGN